MLQVKFEPSQQAALRKICIFIVNHYVESWFTAPIAVSAPRQDLKLLQDLLAPECCVEMELRLAALDKLSRHLWYLGVL